MYFVSWTSVLHCTLIIFTSILPKNSHCDTDDNLPIRLYDTGRFKDISHAINFVHKYLPPEISEEERCKRYAVLSDLAAPEVLPRQSTILDVALMDDDDLDEYYGRMSADRISKAYMIVIERYRITELSPPFIELVDCLRRIETPEVRTYLSNRELIVILDLYKQVLGLPGTTVDVNNLDLTKFHQAFRETLNRLFGRHFPGIFQISDQADTDTGSKSSSYLGATNAQSDTAMRREYLRMQAKSRRRERARLAKQRLRLMNPDLVKEQNRRHQKERRKRNRGKERELLSMEPTTLQEAEAKRRAEERRDRTNERRRLRRKQLREQRLWQRSQIELQVPAEYLLKSGSKVSVPSARTHQKFIFSNPCSFDPTEARTPIGRRDNDSELIEDLFQLYTSVSDTDLHHIQQKQDDADDRRFVADNNQLERSLGLSFEPDTQEERLIHEDLINCAAQPDDTDDVMRFLLDEPETAGEWQDTNHIRGDHWGNS